MKQIKIIIFIAVLLAGTVNLTAHCEIPCGIYEDSLRVNLIREHISTIEKSMNQIEKLEKGETAVNNQLVRWIMNKEEHSLKLQHIVTQYFMTQRIKPGTENYSEKLAALHQLLIYSMKSKQTTDVKYVKKLRSFTDKFEALYFKKK